MLKLSDSVVIGSLMILFGAQAAENGKTDGARPVTFSKDVAPIFQKSCQSHTIMLRQRPCHFNIG